MIIDLYTYKAEDKLFQQQQQQWDQQQRHASRLVIKELINAGAITSKTVIERAYDDKTEPYNYIYYRWCKYCGKIIRFQFFEKYKIVHPNSFLNFYWRKESIKTGWRAFDIDLGKDYDNGIDTDQSWEPHIHIKNKKQSTNGVAA
jgi:hypothetical protein